MTLLVKMPGRSYEISDAYVMALTFIIIFAVTKIVKQVIEKKINKHNKKIEMHNPRGGSTEIKFSDDNELAFTILSCIADNEKYLVKSPNIKKFIFSLVKKKLKNESLVLTPNMIRFLALKLISEDQTLIVKIGNVVFSSRNRVRLLTRLAGTAAIAVLGAVFSILPYAILMIVMYFESTRNCGYDCAAYFQHLPNEVPLQIYAEQSAGHLIIAQNNDAHQVQIYTPSKLPDQVVHTNTGQKVVRKSYEPSRQKAKEIKFDEFKKTDPVLSAFKKLVEPEIPQKSCLSKDVHDILAIKIDN
jgi:hypothetical protein